MTWVGSVWRYRIMPDVKVKVTSTLTHNQSILVIHYTHLDKTRLESSMDQDRFNFFFEEVKA